MDVDVVVVTVIPVELRAVLAALGLRVESRESDGSGTLYYRGALTSALSGRPLRLAVTCVGSPGNPDAAAAVGDAIASLTPRAVILTGIAAGVQGRVRIGEVILSERVVSYEPAAFVAGAAGSLVEARPEIERVPHAMNQHLVTYQPDPRRLDALLACAGGGLPLSSAGAEGAPAPEVKVSRGTIASGEKLLRDSARLAEIRRLHGKIDAVDMESTGVVAACRRSNLPWLIIRGISDHGDALKSDHFHDLAASSAAAVLVDFLEYGLDLPPFEVLRSRAGPAGAAPPAHPVPSPRYADEQSRALGEQLEAGHQRRRALEDAGADTSSVIQEILGLKRQLREGGRLRAGDALGNERFLLLEPLGRGGFASVWKALDRTSNAVVALKVLHSDLAGESQRRDRFFRGARIMAALDHPAVVRVIEPRGEDGGFHYFVMEYMPGGDLRRAVMEGRFAKEQTLDLLLLIGEALERAHADKIVHRDIKPANVLLDERGAPKLTDFDLVAVGDTTGGTRTGPLGTMMYAAPECLARPQEADARADVYGLGMTALFCLHGADLPTEVIRSPEQFLGELDCAEPVRRLLAQAIAWDRGLRHADASVFCLALREALHRDVSAGDLRPADGIADILLWTDDDRGVTETVWLTEHGGEARVVARASALILAAGDQVWVGRKTKRLIGLLDPRDQGRYFEQLRAGDDPAAGLRRVQTEIDEVLLTNVASGKTISLSAPLSSDATPWELTLTIGLLCSVGPYLFTRVNIHAYWGGAHPFHEAHFRVIDLRSGEDTELLKAEDRERLAPEEGQRALSWLRRSEAGSMIEDGNPELSFFQLSYSHALTLRADYTFTVGAPYVASDGKWSSYTRSEVVNSDRLPLALEEYRDAPHILQRYWAKTPRFGAKSTWTAVDRSLKTRAVLKRVFDGDLGGLKGRAG